MASQTPPWNKKNPRKGRGTPLTENQKAMAKDRARKAGRPYPNLVDNMWAAGQ